MAINKAIESYLNIFKSNDLPKKREVAFYGGSFTGLELERQKHLLNAVQPWISSGQINSIRVSTHSLLVNQNNISLLKNSGVQTVELGIQSTNNTVLKSVGRPCELKTVKSAVKIIRDNELKLGMQLRYYDHFYI